MLTRILQVPVDNLLAPEHLLTQPVAQYGSHYSGAYTAPPPCATTACLHDEKALLALLELQRHGKLTAEILQTLQAYANVNAHMTYMTDKSSSYSASPECSPREHYALEGQPWPQMPDEPRKAKGRRGKRGSRGRRKNSTQPELPRAPAWAQGMAWNPHVQAQPVGDSPAGTGVFIPGAAAHPAHKEEEEDDVHFDCDLRELLGNLPEVWEY